MKHARWITGLLIFALLLCRPEAAANGAREAMAQRYYAVAPSLFPFMALMPLVMCEPAMEFCESALGGLMNRLFRLPGSAASAMAVGMLAGSPAGSVAVRRAASRGDMDGCQLERLASAACGLSPAFLVSGVGAAMLGSAAYGRLLLGSQVATQLILLALPAFGRRGAAVDPPEVSIKEENPVAFAVRSVLMVGGAMALFGALGQVARGLAGDAAGKALLCVMEVSSGARVLCEANLPMPVKLAALSCLAGWGGLCVGAQNLAVLRDCGVRGSGFIARRLAAGLIGGGITLARLRLAPLIATFPALPPLRLAALCACALLLPAIFKIKRTVF